jgi:hypothetical protein
MDTQSAIHIFTHREKEINMSVFTHAGVSTLNGVTKARFANDALRVKVLAKNGHRDIDIVELKTPMSKEDAVAFLISIDFATQNGVTNAATQSALEDAVEKRSVKPASAPKVAKVAKAPKAKVPAKKGPSMDAIRAKAAATKAVPKSTVSKAAIVAQMEDAPY